VNPKKNYKISLEQLSLKGRELLAKQSETSYAKALAQIQLLKKNSKVGQSSKKGGQTS